jgi:large conductance mechanosensitive channel
MKNPVKKPSWWEEFKAFAIKGNAMALAVGTIIGGAFSTITKSLTNDLIMPIVNIFLGGADFSEAKIALPRMPWVQPTYETVVNEAGEEVVQLVENYLTYGNLISAVINFFILALVVFFLVKGLNKLSELGKKKEIEEAAAEPPAPPAPSNEEILLTEIRDLLKEK